MAKAEDPIPALLLVQLTSDQLVKLAPSLSAQDLRDLMDTVARYQAPIRRRVERIGARVANAAGRSDINFALASLGLNAAAPQGVWLADRVRRTPNSSCSSTTMMNSPPCSAMR